MKNKAPTPLTTLARAYRLYVAARPNLNAISACCSFLYEQHQRNPTFIEELCAAYADVDINECRLYLKVGQGRVYVGIAHYIHRRHVHCIANWSPEIQREVIDNGIQVLRHDCLVPMLLWNLSDAQRRQVLDQGKRQVRNREEQENWLKRPSSPRISPISGKPYAIYKTAKRIVTLPGCHIWTNELKAICLEVLPERTIVELAVARCGLLNAQRILAGIKERMAHGGSGRGSAPRR